MNRREANERLCDTPKVGLGVLVCLSKSEAGVVVLEPLMESETGASEAASGSPNLDKSIVAGVRFPDLQWVRPF